ncbi:MAG: signal peptidase I [Candidatus Aureabacteria bacterium]|nr:signal peptidase I [Candidatus Auribacterota bacterium]
MGFLANRKKIKYAKLLLKTSKTLYRKHGRKIAEKDASVLESDMKAMSSALAARNISEIEKATERLDRSFERHLAFAKKSLVREYAEAFILALVIALFLRTFVIQLFKIPTGSMEPTLWGAQNHHGFGDHIVVNKFIYGPQTFDWVGIPWTNHGFDLPTWRIDKLGLRKPMRGDIIVFKFPFNYHCNQCSPSSPSSDFNLKPGQPLVCPACGSRDIEYQNKDFVKRCIGLPGQTVEIRGGHIYINDQLITEPKPIGDIYYTNIPPDKGPYGHVGQKFTIPEDNYFMMGDNSTNSKDSRMWGLVPFQNIRGRAVFIYLPLKRVGVIR